MINFEKQFDNIESKFKEIENNLNNQSNLDTEKLIKLNKEYAELTPIVETIKKYKKNKNDISELFKLIDDDDHSIKEMAEEELKEKKKLMNILENDLMRLLIPKDENDKKNSILEIRAGTGGDEASLFAADLFTMYQRFSDLNKWNFEILSISETGLKGIKEVICNISGNNVFSKLKFESGVHRVQRVPATESSGRVHTSAATVAVLPEAEEVDINIEEKDLRIDVFRSSGPGGQSVNTTDSAVRITHIPTGIVVSQQDEKSQHKNKAKALKILRSRILDNEIQEKNKQRSIDRKNQVGSGDRSERIRTYNFPQGRVSDHRINLTLYNLTEILEGSLNDLINPLIANEETNKLAELGNE
ncbi:peptide chain release factor 1 [Pelagibacteraceae bacterium]|nr:peptide chain release factor 1 [Pelagibacteraceae bacterium]